MERRPVGGAGLNGSGPGLDRLLTDLGVTVPIRHAVSSIVTGPPSEIQSAALADAVAGRDVLTAAPTGSGKTLVFAIAVAQLLTGSPSIPGRPRAIVVAPTRELATQSAEILADVGAGSGLRVATFLGGQSISKDRRALVPPVDVVVGTPGRLVDLLTQRAMSTDDARILVLDEADHLLGPSFGEQTSAIVDRCGHVALLAATATADARLEGELLTLRPGLRVHRVEPPPRAHRPDAHQTGPSDTATTGPPRRLVVVSAVEPDGVAVTLAARCRRALFFVPRRDAVEPLRASIVATGVTATGVVGSASPTRRSAAFADLASGAVRVLVSTDLAGRGLDLDGIGHVVHVGPPHSIEDLVHRSGRTGRGDAAAGTVVAIVRPSEVARICAQAQEVGMAVDRIDADSPSSNDRISALLGPEIATPRRRRAPAPPARSRRPEKSRVHRPKKKRNK